MAKSKPKPSVPRQFVLMGLVALAVIAGALGWVLLDRFSGPPKFVRATIGGERFRLETCFDDKSRADGMMGRDSLGDDEGMIFVFPDTRKRGFWMKGCLIDLDIVYLDEAGRVVSFTTMKRPAPGTPDHRLPNYPSYYPCRYAIELRAGRAKELGIKEADLVELPLSTLKKWAR